MNRSIIEIVSHIRSSQDNFPAQAINRPKVKSRHLYIEHTRARKQETTTPNIFVISRSDSTYTRSEP